MGLDARRLNLNRVLREERKGKVDILIKVRELIVAYRNKDWWTAAKIGFALAVTIADALSKLNEPRVVGTVNPDQTVDQMIEELDSITTYAPDRIYSDIAGNVIVYVLVLKIVRHVTNEIISRLGG